jgi:hypothetical protein
MVTDRQVKRLRRVLSLGGDTHAGGGQVEHGREDGEEV